MGESFIEFRARLEQDRRRVLKLIDQATDPGWDLELAPPGTSDAQDEERRAAIQERIAAALGAIAFFMLRRDDEMWDEWKTW